MRYKVRLLAIGRIEEEVVKRHDRFARRRKFGESRGVDLKRERELGSVAKDGRVVHRQSRESTMVESE